jgi:hypothetical protein
MLWKIDLGTLIGTCVVVGASAFLAGRAVAGGIPTVQPLVYSGVLHTAEGTPFTASGHNIEIKLWDSATAGTQLCDTSSKPLTVDGSGHFSLPLVDPVNDCATAIGAHPDTYVEILLDGAVLGGARSKLGAVPYAVEANHSLNADTARAATGNLEARLAALEAKDVQVLTWGWLGNNCKPLAEFSKPGYRNVLVRASLFTDEQCKVAANDPATCHPHCASSLLDNPAAFSTVCCNATYFTLGVVDTIVFK